MSFDDTNDLFEVIQSLIGNENGLEAFNRQVQEIGEFSDASSGVSLSPEAYSVEDMQESRAKIEILEELNIFRNESEIQEESKGGFVKANIHLPEGASDFTIRLSLASVNDTERNMGIHPNLLFLKGEGKSRPLTNKDWKIEFRGFRNEKGQFVLVAVSREKKNLFKTLGGEEVYGEDFSTARNGDSLMLGHDGGSSKDSKKHVKKGLRINVIKAAQKKTKDVTQSMDGVILDRLLDLDPNRSEAELLKSPEFKALKKYFSFSGETKNAMHMVRLKLDYRDQNGLELIEHSVPIHNSSSPWTAKMELIDLTQDRICEKGNVLLTVLLKQKNSDKNIEAWLVDPEEDPEAPILAPFKIDISGKIGIVEIPNISIQFFKPTYELKLYNETLKRLSNGVPIYMERHRNDNGDGFCFCQLKKNQSESPNKAGRQTLKSRSRKRPSFDVRMDSSTTSPWSSSSGISSVEPPECKRPSTDAEMEFNYLEESCALEVSRPLTQSTNDFSHLESQEDFSGLLNDCLRQDTFFGSPPASKLHLEGSNTLFSWPEVVSDGSSTDPCVTNESLDSSFVEAGSGSRVSFASLRKRPGLVVSTASRSVSQPAESPRNDSRKLAVKIHRERSTLRGGAEDNNWSIVAFILLFIVVGLIYVSKCYFGLL